MLCIFNANGGLFSVTPSQVYQGSNKASTIQLLAPLDSTVLMQVSFTLPNGKVTKPVPVSLATETGYSGIEDEHGNKVFLWEYEVPFAITSYTGKVKTQFKALNGQGQVISTMSFYFDVLEGNAPIEVEEIDNYEALIAYLQQLNLAWTNNYNYLLQNSWQLGNLSFLNLQEHSTLASVTTPATYMFSGQSDAPPDVSTGILYNVAYMGSFASLQVVFAVSYKTAKPQYYPPKLFIRTISNSTPTEWAEIANLKDIENIVSNLNYNIEDGSGEKAVQQKGTQANADNSASFGLETVANAKGQVVVGVANDSQSDDLFEVGNGEVDESGNVLNRSNAFRVLKDGRAKMPNGTGTDNDDVVNQFGLKLKLDPILTDLDNVLSDFESFTSEVENVVNALLGVMQLVFVYMDYRQLSLSFDNYFSAQNYFMDTPPNFMPDEFPTELPYLYVGQSVYIKQLNVPDLWISNIYEELDGYYAETNEELIAKLEQNGSLRIGYYELSPLETAKVNLVDYYTKEQVDNNFAPKPSNWDSLPGYASTVYIRKNDGTAIMANIDASNGLAFTNRNILVVSGANNSTIDSKNSGDSSAATKPICPKTLDYAVKSGVTANSITLTDEEKQSACTWLGVTDIVDELVGDINSVLEAILGV